MPRPVYKWKTSKTQYAENILMLKIVKRNVGEFYLNWTHYFIDWFVMVAAVAAAANVCGQVRWDHEDGSHFGTTCTSFLYEEIE